MGRTFYTNRKKIDKLTNEEKLDLMLDLIYAFGIVKRSDETAVFMQDLLTANEVRNLSVRLRIAKLLLAGLTYQEIIDTVHTSNTTIHKVSVWLEQGGEGFKNVIAKLPLKWKKPKNLPRGPIEFHLPELLLAIAQYKLSERRMGAVKKLATKMNEKEGIDRTLKEANKFLYMGKK